MFTGTSILTFFQQNPALAVFLTVALGFWIGKFRYKSFSLGTVTSVLLIGVLVGQMNIPIPEPAKTIFFLIFLFAVGYNVGPQFFRGLKKDGLPQAGFAVIVCVLCLASVYVCAKVMGYNAAQAAGLLAGSQTISAVLGVAGDTIKQMPSISGLDQSVMPVCYAVTYIFGTAGSAWILSALGPRMLGGVNKVKSDAAALEQQMGQDLSSTPGFNSAVQDVEFRAFKAENVWFKGGKTIKEFEKYMQDQGKRLFVERVRIGKCIKDPNPKLVIQQGDTIVVSGRREYVIEEDAWIGTEVEDNDLVNFAIEVLPVVVNKKGAAGEYIKTILTREYMHGVSIRNIRRAGVKIPVLGAGKLDAGDRIELVGLKQDVQKAASKLGFSDPETTSTSMTLVGISILLGGLIFGWMLVAKIGNIPLSLTVSGGALIAGLVAGWARSKRPTFGYIPEQSIWFMNNVGLNVFIAIVGITAGPTFVQGFKEVGWSLFVVGAVATSLPLIIGVLLGRYVFKFNSALNLGCVAGSRTTTAALGAIEEAIGSNVPAMGYTVTYAIGNTLLIIWGVVIVLLMA